MMLSERDNGRNSGALLHDVHLSNNNLRELGEKAPSGGADVVAQGAGRAD